MDPHILSPSSICCTHNTGHRCPAGKSDDEDPFGNSNLVHCTLQLILLKLPDLLSVVCCLLLVLSAGVHCVIIHLKIKVFHSFSKAFDWCYLSRLLAYLPNWLISILNGIVIHHLIEVGLKLFSRRSRLLQQYRLLARGWRR